MQAISDAVALHSKELLEQKQHMDGQSVKLAHLEELVAAARPMPAIAFPLPTNQPVAPGQSPNLPVSTNVNRFSEQEKRILTVFFHNPGMPLSYQDVGHALGKSSNTVKNQFHQIAIKADLFEKSVDAESRNRFRLKDGLKVEQYLNLT